MEDKDFLNTLENWNDKVLNEHDLIADSRELINQLNTAFPFLASRSLVVNNDLVSSTGDWNDLQGNTVYAYKSLNGKNSPDSQKLGTSSGIVLTLQTQDRTLTNQLVIPTGSNELSLAYRSNMGSLAGSTWSYLTPSELYSNLLKSDNVFTGVNKYMTPPQDKDGNSFITAQNVSQLDPTIVHGKDLTGVANLLSVKNSISGYITNEGTLQSSGLLYSEKNSDYIEVNNQYPYNLNVYVTIPNGDYPWTAISLYDKDKKFIKRYATLGDAQTKDSYVEYTYWILPKGDTSKVPTYNFTDETQYVRISWRNYNDAKVMLTRGYYPQDYVPNLDDLADDNTLVHKSDVLGGRNYLTNTDNPTTSNPIQLFGEVAGIDGNVDYSTGRVKLTTETSGETYYRFNGADRRMPLQAGQTYTLSYNMSGTAGIYLATRIIYAEDTVPTWDNLLLSYHACTTKFMNYKDTFTVPDTTLSLIVSVQIYADTNKNNDNTGTNYVEFSNVMLEKGEVQHDWVPSPDDFPSTVDQSVMVKNTLTADDDVLTLDPGTYYTWGVEPKNFPALASWSTVVVKAVGNQPIDGKNVTITDIHASQLVNTYSGSASTGNWSGWRVPNSATMASKSDVQVAVNTATTDMMKTTDWVYHSSADDAETASSNDNLFHYSDD